MNTLTEKGSLGDSIIGYYKFFAYWVLNLKNIYTDKGGMKMK